MLGFDLDTTKAPAVDWGNRAAPVMPAGADLVMKAVTDAGLNAHGQDPVMNEIYRHYTDEDVPFGPKWPAVSSAWLSDDGLAGQALEAIPGARAGLNRGLRTEYANHQRGHEYRDLIDACVAKDLPLAEAACAVGLNPHGEHDADPAHCMSVSLDGRKATTRAEGTNTGTTNIKTTTNGHQGGINLGFANLGGSSSTANADGDSKGSSVTDTVATEAIAGIKRRCTQEAFDKLHKDAR